MNQSQKVYWFNQGWGYGVQGLDLPYGRFSGNDTQDGVSELDLARHGLRSFHLGLPSYPSGELLKQVQEAEARNVALLAKLSSIYALLSPEDIEAEDGRVFRFNHPNPAEILRAISAEIRSIIIPKG